MTLQDLKDKIQSIENELKELNIPPDYAVLQSDFITEVQDVEMFVSDYLGHKYVYFNVPK